MDYFSEPNRDDNCREYFDSALDAESRLPIAKLKRDSDKRTNLWGLFRFPRQEVSTR